MTTLWPKLYKVVPYSKGHWWIETKQLYPNVRRIKKDFVFIIIQEEGLERLTLVPRNKVPSYIPIPGINQQHPYQRGRNRRFEEYYRDYYEGLYFRNFYYR